MSSDTLLRLVDQWAEAREARLVVYRQMLAFRCEFYSPAEWDVGHAGVPRCRHSGSAVDEWCEPCQARDALYNRVWLLRKIESEQFSLLCAFLKRRSEKARKVGAVDPQAEATAG